MSGAKWQSVEQMHIILLFLGDVEEERLLALCLSSNQLPHIVTLDVINVLRHY